MIGRTSFILAAFTMLLIPLAPARGGELPGYLTAPADDGFAWEVAGSLPIEGGTLTVIKLTSQRWQGMLWEHWLQVIEPAEVRHLDRALLLIGGGRQRKEAPLKASEEVLLLMEAAREAGTIVAHLMQVPNQPLFGGLTEDALIAHTFMKWVETQDDSWPALLPMTKSAIRAMDAIQAYTQKTRGQAVERFFVTGASKRGWTTWLTAAADRRVFAIAPMVIDVLNMKKQLPHQVEMLGGYSEMIHDYTQLGLPQLATEPTAQRLLDMVDPWNYRERLTMPKLIVLGTNDPYWAVDALKLYFDDLPGEKYIHYVPNAGHGLGPSAVEAVRSFYETLLEGKKAPRFAWHLDGSKLTVDAKDRPVEVHLWQASSTDRDFRNDQWSSVKLEAASKKYHAEITVPEKGFVACYAALTYVGPSGRRYQLCTNIEVLGSLPRRAWF